MLTHVNPVCFIKLSIQSESQPQACQRKLVELSLYVNDSLSKRGKNDYFNKPYVSTKVLPFGCEEKDISKKLSRSSIEKLLNNTGFLFADKKKAYIVFYYLIDYHKGKYQKMINKLWLVFTELAAKSGMPDEQRLKFLMDCHSALARDFDTLDESYENRFFSMAKNKFMLQLSFRIFISSLVWSNVKLRRVNKKKWKKAMMNIIETYKA
ncbi:RAD protein [Plasmodium cynomolgi strain B]|uniref:RAD protein n=1 Tax=Plasmodium cynomolgi (strain B) TaxID=1120755 RepID=K6V816_PLACD|nr:RAD protein [Plasmodium cynomolgi strain B]GAB65282.1 RAD protein [Plasmodium cynomolgi strain B]